MNRAERLERGSTKYQDTMKSNHQPNVYLKIGGDHANQWGIYKSRPKWGICLNVASKRDISENQMSSNHPYLQLNQAHESKGSLPEGKQEDIEVSRSVGPTG